MCTIHVLCVVSNEKEIIRNEIRSDQIVERTKSVANQLENIGSFARAHVHSVLYDLEHDARLLLLTAAPSGARPAVLSGHRELPGVVVRWRTCARVIACPRSGAGAGRESVLRRHRQSGLGAGVGGGEAVARTGSHAAIAVLVLVAGALAIPRQRPELTAAA